jgi:CRP/FNR family transcriptional regulator, cAMP and macrophage regulator
MKCMAFTRFSSAAMDQAMRLLGTASADEMAIRHAAWVARCVGRGDSAPLTPDALTRLAATLQQNRLSRGSVLFHGGEPTDAVWIVQHGRVELSVGSGRRRTVVGVMRPGDVDGDIQLLLDMPLPYTARALDDATVLSLVSGDFEHLLATSLPIARRWLSSVAGRLAASQTRLVGLLGNSLTEQISRLLLDEAVDGQVALPQRTVAAMLGVQRPSLNKILKELERESLVEVRYGAIDILDREALVKRAG